ncbi:MAG: alpha/beta hydrolase [Silicimonas sp.]|nr:alpha/beta hydrolase [Silicimonas sp.]
MRRPVLTTFLFLSAALIAFAVFTDRRADLREAAIESRFPPTGEIVNVDGTDVHVLIRGEGPDLVLIHGAGGNARDLSFALVDDLANRYRVFSVDRPGLGYSDAIAPDTPMAQARVLAQATRRLGADNPIVLGHSYGGAVAMGWALEEPSAGLVIVAGATMPWPGPLQPYYRIFGSKLGGWIGAPLVSAYVSDEQIATTVASVFDPAPIPENYITGAAIPLATRIESFRRSAAQVKRLRPNVVEMSAHYGGLTLPVEVLHGTDDTTVRPEIHAVPLSKTLPNANLTLLDGVGHAPHHVATKAVLDAIDSVAKRAGLR